MIRGYPYHLSFGNRDAQNAWMPVYHITLTPPLPFFKGKSPGNEVVIYCHRSQILRSPPLVKSQGELNYQHHLGTACKHRHINFLRGETSLCIFEALLWSLHCDCLQKSKEAPGYKVCGEKRHSVRCLCLTATLCLA